VGDGVLSGTGEEVGAGVGTQVVHSRDTCFAIPPATQPDSKTFHISEPTGGV
jgi:hypothetical protein